MVRPSACMARSFARLQKLCSHHNHPFPSLRSLSDPNPSSLCWPSTLLSPCACLIRFFSFPFSLPSFSFRFNSPLHRSMASWDQIRSEVRSFRASVQPTVTTMRDFVFDTQRDRIFFLANDLTRSSKSPMLFRVDLPRPFADSDSDSDLSLGDSQSQDGSDQDQDQDQDQDMGLVPFNPETYQFFAGPPPTPIQAIPGARESDPSSRPSSSHPRAHAHAHDPSTTLDTSAATDQILAAAPVLPWTPVLTEEWLKLANAIPGHTQNDRLSCYQFEPQANRLLFPYGSIVYTADVQEVHVESCWRTELPSCEVLDSDLLLLLFNCFFLGRQSQSSASPTRPCHVWKSGSILFQYDAVCPYCESQLCIRLGASNLTEGISFRFHCL